MSASFVENENMKAVYQTRYGAPEVLSIRELPVPEPKPDELLIRVHATTFNRSDCVLVAGSPHVIRLFSGLFRPKRNIPGTDFAGEVVKTGTLAPQFKPGDRVFGFEDTGLSTMAEYIVVSVKKPIAQIPAGISFEEAVASLEAAHYAINFVNKVNLQEGDKVLVHGASGGIGSALVQILKRKGCYVVATCFSRDLEKTAKLGADRMIELDKSDFTQDAETYDLIMDSVGKSTFGQCKKLLKPKGIYISSELGPWWQNPFLALFTPIGGGKKVIFPVPVDIPESIRLMSAMLSERSFRPLLDRVYPMEKISEANEYVRSGKKIGNVLVTFR